MKSRPAAPVVVGVLVVVIACAVVAVGVVLAGDGGGGSGSSVEGRPLGAGSDMVVSDVLLSEGRVRRATVVRDEARPPLHTLYGEDGLDDPLEGRTLAVGSGFDDAIPVVPTVESEGFRAVDVGGRRGAVGTDRDWVWVTWSLPDCTDECHGYVAGRNLSEGEALRAAQEAVVGDGDPSIAAGALPKGLVPLVTGGMHLGSFVMRSAQTVSWSSGDGDGDGDGGGDGGASLTVVADERMALLLRFWVGGEPIPVRGHAGSSGSLARLGTGGAIGSVVDGRAWAEGGRALLVLGGRLAGDELDRFVTALRPAEGDEWERVRGRVLDIPSETVIEGCYAPDEPLVAVGRGEGRYRWAVGFGVGRNNGFTFCDVVMTADGRHLGSAGGERPAPGEVSVATTGIGGATDPVGLFVMGVAPPGTATVRVDLADGRVVDAELAGEGPAPGERYFAVFLEGDADGIRRSQPAVVAVDGSGVELSRATADD